MSPEKTHSAESAGSPSSTRRKPRRWRRMLLLLLVLIAGVIAFAPQIVTRTSLRNSVIARLAPGLQGKVVFGQASLGWLRPVEIERVQLLHTNGERWGLIENLKSRYTLLDLVLEPSDLGLWTASRCEVIATCAPGTSDVEQWLDELSGRQEGTPQNLSFETSQLHLTLRSPDVESVFELSNAAYQQSKSGAVSFRFQGTPAERKQDQTQSLTLAARFDEGVSWDINGTNFPVQQLEPLLVRFEIEERLSGQLNGDWTITRQDGPHWQIETDGTLSDFQFRSPDRQLADVERLELQLSLTRTDSGWHVTSLTGKTDIGEIALDGELDLPATGESWEAKLDQLLDQSFTLQGTFEMGELAKRFPALVTLQEGVQLNQGTCDFHVKSHPEDSRRLLTASLDVSEIEAQTPGSQISWQNPLHAKATVSQENESWKVEDLNIHSKSVALTGSGTWESAELDADIDLAGFVQEWNQIFDLGDLQLAGTMQAHAKSSLQPSRQIGLNGHLTGRNLVIGWGAETPWRVAQLKSEFKGNGQISEAGEFELSTLTGNIHTEKELLTLTCVDPAAGHWNISGSGDMTGLAGQLLSRVSTTRLLGQYQIEADWFRDSRHERFENLNLEIQDFECDLGKTHISEPQMKLTGDITLERPSRKVSSAELVLNCPTLAARGNNLNLSTAGGLRLTGKLAARGRVERLRQYAKLDSNSLPHTGFLNLQLSAKSETRAATHVNWKLTADQLQWPAKEAVNAVKPVSSSGSVPDTINPEWTGRGRLLPQLDEFVVEESVLKSDVLNFNLRGKVTALTTAPVASIEGVCRYDWTQLTTRYPGLLGEDLKLYGSHQSPVKLTIPVSRMSDDNRDRMAGSVSLTWDRGEWNALPIGGGTLTIDLSPQRMTVQPLKVSVAGGTASFGPTIERSKQGAVLLQKPERLLDRVQLTDEICHEWLKYVSPLTADAARVSGSFTVDSSQLIRVPLNRWQQMSAEGLVQIHTAEMRPGPLAMQFITLSKQIEALRRGTPFDPQAADPDKPVMTITRQTVPCKIENGRVHHKDLTIELRDLSIRSSGSVGFDDSLDLVTQITIPEKWKIRGKPVREIWGATVQIPVRGTISRPQMDPRVIQSLMDRLVRGTVTNFLEEELNKQIKKLFQP